MSPLELAEFVLPPLRPAAAAFAARGCAGGDTLATGAGGLKAGFGCEVTAGDAGFTGGALTAGAGFGAAGPFCAGWPGFAAAAALLALSLHRSRSFTRSCPDWYRSSGALDSAFMMTWLSAG